VNAEEDAELAEVRRQWDEWYAEDFSSHTFAQQVSESPHDKMHRAFLAGWAAARVRGRGEPPTTL
jgi:hypothetical protein